MNILSDILLAASLCADCFAVSLVTGVSLNRAGKRKIAFVALLFALIQTAFLLAGFFFGELIADLVWRISKIIAFLILLYVGGSMIYESIKGEEDSINLTSFRNIILAGTATSIDALAVGAAEAFAGGLAKDIWPLAAAVAVITALSVVTGLLGSRFIPRKWGRVSETAGGIVLIIIGIMQLIA